MNYLGINKCDTGNGPGIRVSFWVSGCNHHCKGCHNPESWIPNAGEKYDKNIILPKLIKSLKPNYISGLTLTGGDPLFPDNRDKITEIAKIVKNETGKSIWLWTGYLWEEIKNLEIIYYIDVLVDGEYDETKRNVALLYCGSENQRVIDVRKSLEINEIIKYETREII